MGNGPPMLYQLETRFVYISCVHVEEGVYVVVSAGTVEDIVASKQKLITKGEDILFRLQNNRRE